MPSNYKQYLDEALKYQSSIMFLDFRGDTGALKRSIRFAATDKDVVVGATLSEIGMVANLHEFGGTPKKKKPRTTKYRNNWRLQIGGHSPNLNLIERYWKFLKKKCLYNQFYGDFDSFREAIDDCIANADKNFADELKTLMTLNFQSFENVQFLAV